MKVMIVGACSAIAEATAKRLAERGCELFLVARNADRLQTMADDLQVRGARSATIFTADACDYDAHEPMLQKAIESMGGLDTVLIAHGTLPDQEELQKTWEATAQALNENFLSVVGILTPVANYMEEQGSGTIAVISSVAGDRGRQSNYVYGSAKGAVSIFLQGLRNRLFHSGVNVLTIKPGFVKTPMTADIAGDGFMWAEADDIAEGIIKGIDKGRNVVYLPSFWWVIMTIIKSIPETVFKRLKL